MLWPPTNLIPRYSILATLRPMLENSEAKGSTGTGQLTRLTLGTSSSLRSLSSSKISGNVTAWLEMWCYHLNIRCGKAMWHLGLPAGHHDEFIFFIFEVKF